MIVEKRLKSTKIYRQEGRRCRDTFASLKKTAGKLKITFWDYLLDRLTGQQRIAPLADLITQAAALIAIRAECKTWVINAWVFQQACSF